MQQINENQTQANEEINIMNESNNTVRIIQEKLKGKRKQSTETTFETRRSHKFQ